MDLKTFVSETLTQIVEGVQDAQERIRERGIKAEINPWSIGAESTREIGQPSPVDFDVAVVIAEETSNATGEKARASAGLISVVSLRAGGELESGRSSGARNETTSRIRFTVQLAQPADIRRQKPVNIPRGRVV